MSKVKLVLEVVEDLKSLANSIECLVCALEGNESVEKPKEKTKKKSMDQTAEIITSNDNGNVNNDEHHSKDLEIDESSKEKIESPGEYRPSLEEVREAMAEKSRDGHREALRAILTKYGVNNLTTLDSKFYADVLKEVGAIR